VIKVLYSLLALVAGSSDAYAHAKLMTSVPADGSHVAAGLSQLKFTFSKSMRLTVVKVSLEQSQSAILPIEDLPGNSITSATIKIPALEAGAYSVEWTAVATDGHVMTGTIDFVIDADTGARSE
jgi:copper resistance protein C